MNVLLSSVGRRSYLVHYFQEALDGKGLVVATNCIAQTTGMIAADVAEVVPPAKDSSFIDSLLDVCKRHEVKLLCSLHDWEAPFIAEHRDKFLEIGVIPVIADPSVIDICLDKYKMWQFLEKHGIRSVRTFIDLEAAENALKSGTLRFPLVLKPRWGQGSIGIKKVYSLDQLIHIHSWIIAELESNEFYYPLKGAVIDQIIIQQFVEGIEYGVDIVNDLNGNYAACFVKRKFAMRSGETDAAETVQHPTIETIAREIALATRHCGNMDADFLVTENGEAIVLELNPRFGGGYPFSHEAGANIPAALIAWAKGEQPDPNWLKIKYGVCCLKDISMMKV